MTINSRMTLGAVAVSAALLSSAAMAAPATAVTDSSITVSGAENGRYGVEFSDASVWEEGDGQAVAVATLKCRAGWVYGLGLQLTQAGTTTGHAVVEGTCTGEEQSQNVLFSSDGRFEKGSAVVDGMFVMANDDNYGIFFKVTQTVELT